MKKMTTAKEKIKLPREDNQEGNLVLMSIHENSSRSYIDFGLTSRINEVEYFDWFLAFKEHYANKTGKAAECRSVRDGFGPAIRIPYPESRITFIVDYSHKALKFYIDEKDEKARDIIYSFAETLLPEKETAEQKAKLGVKNDKHK